jgi:prophage regulatory protein
MDCRHGSTATYFTTILPLLLAKALPLPANTLDLRAFHLDDQVLQLIELKGAHQMEPTRKVIRKYLAHKKLGIGRSTLALWLNPKSKYFDPTLPAQVSLGKNSTGFFDQDLDKWLESRIQKST